MTVGERIALHRERAGMTQEELASGIHMSQSHLSCIETGRRRPSVRVLEAISIALGVTPNDLLGFDSRPAA